MKHWGRGKIPLSQNPLFFLFSPEVGLPQVESFSLAQVLILDKGSKTPVWRDCSDTINLLHKCDWVQGQGTSGVPTEKGLSTKLSPKVPRDCQPGTVSGSTTYREVDVPEGLLPAGNS